MPASPSQQEGNELADQVESTVGLPFLLLAADSLHGETLGPAAINDSLVPFFTKSDQFHLEPEDSPAAGAKLGSGLCLDL